MKLDISLQKNNIIIGVVALLILVGGYFGYSLLSSDDSGVTVSADPSLFKGNIKNFYPIRNEINLDPSFMTGKNEELFNQLVNYSQDIPLKDPEGTSKGRSNPFVPYVAP